MSLGEEKLNLTVIQIHTYQSLINSKPSHPTAKMTNNKVVSVFVLFSLCSGSQLHSLVLTQGL